jgi:phenylpropionate dioxygenase-like ring-hydroxylating dioxygenase large terminal subunit
MALLDPPAPAVARRDDDAASLIAQIREQAARPLEQAITLPPAVYSSEALYAIEVERIFRRDWMCVAREEQLEAPGSWMAVDLVDEPLLLTRDEAGVLHCLSRVCRHRAIDLLAGCDDVCGTTARLKCPYHQWSYRLDGALIGAPEMQASELFARDEIALVEFPLETWQGFVFVNLDRNATPLAPEMAMFDELLAGRDLSTWRIVGTVPWGDTQVSWKVVIENGCECYHHIGTHKDTLQPLWPGQTVGMAGSKVGLCGRMVASPELAVGQVDGWNVQPTVFPVAEDLPAEHLATTFVVGKFPMFFAALGPDQVAWFRWLPTGPTSHVLDIHLLVHPETAARADIESLRDVAIEMVHAIQAEDAVTNEAVMRGARGAHAMQGPLSHLEAPLLWFQQYLADRLGD